MRAFFLAAGFFALGFVTVFFLVMLDCRISPSVRQPRFQTIPLPKRAKHDARGQVLRHGVTYSVAHTDGQPWTILRSKHGRTNQVDLHVGAALAFTGSLRSLERGMSRAKL